MHTLAFPVLNTERTLLRQITIEDLQNIYKGLSHPEVIKYYGVSFDSLEATREQMRWFRELETMGTGIWWAICSADNRLFYGAGGFNALSVQHRKAEIGFWLLPEYWGKGLMQEVFPVICRYGFQQLNLHRIEGFVDSDNINCRTAIEKMGFLLEGRMRECEIKDGKFLSIAIYSKLSTD